MFPIELGQYPANGEPITLHVLTVAEADELFDVTDRNRRSLRQWLPWLDWSNSPADTAEHLRTVEARHHSRNGFGAGIRIGRRLAGSIGLHAIDERHRSSSIGYWLSEEFRGGGVMTAACRAVVTEAFEHYGLHRIEIRCATKNHKSRAVPQRLGFVQEGILREAEWLYDHFVDLVVYSMLEQDWPGPTGRLGAR